MTRGWQPELAEAIGTFFIVAVGGASILLGQPGWLVALAFGGTVMVAIYATGHLSGAHFNPAITLGFAVTGHFPWGRAARYGLAQFLGAVAAVGLLRAWKPVDAMVAHGAMTGMPGFVVEVLATFLLAFVIVAVATDSRAPAGFAGLAIGSTVALGALAAGPLTGAAMNPARALAPALLASDYGGIAIHILGPLAGGVLGMTAYEIVRQGAKPRPDPAPAKTVQAEAA